MLVLTSKARHNKHADFELQLDTGSESILPIQNVSLLGCNITDDLKWYQHTVGSDKSMVNQLKNRLNALRKVCPFLSFKNRKMNAQGIIMSNICYMIQLYGNAVNNLMSMLQVVQNSENSKSPFLEFFCSYLATSMWMVICQTNGGAA